MLLFGGLELKEKFSMIGRMSLDHKLDQAGENYKSKASRRTKIRKKSYLGSEHGC